MMLREGWDVRNVTVVLGLRPFTAKAEILPEQVIGRGLRLMTQVSPDRTQTLEVLGTRNLLNVLRSQLEAEGVGVASTKTDPPPPVIISPIQERLAYDIAIPITKPKHVHGQDSHVLDPRKRSMRFPFEPERDSKCSKFSSLITPANQTLKNPYCFGEVRRFGEYGPERDKFGLRCGSLGQQLWCIDRADIGVLSAPPGGGERCRDRSWRREWTRRQTRSEYAPHRASTPSKF